MFALTVIQIQIQLGNLFFLTPASSLSKLEVDTGKQQGQTYKQTEAEVRSQHSATTDELFARVDIQPNGGGVEKATLPI